MTRVRLLILFAAVLTLAVVAVPRRADVAAAQARGGAKAATAAAETPCDLWAYVLDPDPQGLNVRSGPGKQFAAVAKLPHVEYNLEVHVTGASGQWLRVSEASEQDSGKNVFKGSGWVYGPALGTDTKDYGGMDPNEPRVKLYKDASERSGVVLRLPNETEVALTGCKWHWARVRHKSVEGWLAPDSQCHSTLTTCS